MQVQLLVERDQNECIVNLAGTAYKFKRNEYGHLVSEITYQEHIKWLNNPHNTSFKPYSAPKKKITEEVVDDAAPVAGKSEDRPPYPQKGSKRPPKGSKR